MNGERQKEKEKCIKQKEGRPKYVVKTEQRQVCGFIWFKFETFDIEHH